MAIRQEVLQAMGYLAAAYPEQGSKIDPRVLELQNAVYVENLADVPAAALMAAAREHVKTSAWFPRISELRTLALRLDSKWFETEEHRKNLLRFGSSRTNLELEDGSEEDE